MTTRKYDPSKPDVPEFDTSREQHLTIDNRRTAEVFRKMKLCHLIGAFDTSYQNK